MTNLEELLKVSLPLVINTDFQLPKILIFYLKSPWKYISKKETFISSLQGMVNIRNSKQFFISTHLPQYQRNCTIATRS